MPASVSFTGSARNARQSSEDARAVRQGQKAACVFDEYLSVLKDRDVRLREQAKLAAGIFAREPGIITQAPLVEFKVYQNAVLGLAAMLVRKPKDSACNAPLHGALIILDDQ